jgi:hypothetical protein
MPPPKKKLQIVLQCVCIGPGSNTLLYSVATVQTDVFVKNQYSVRSKIMIIMIIFNKVDDTKNQGFGSSGLFPITQELGHQFFQSLK